MRKDTEYRRLRIVHLLHSFGTGGMEKGIAAVVQQTHGEFEHIIMCLTTGGDSEKCCPGGSRSSHCTNRRAIP